MSRRTVYLAGPITGQSYAGAVDWREEAKSFLEQQGIEGLSPMRGKQYLLAENKIGDKYDQYVLSTSRAIMTRDYFDCKRCDVLLVNLLGATRVSIGTCLEIAWAYDKHTPVILVMEEDGNPHDHAMLREATGYRVKSLEEGLSVVLSVLLP